MKQFLVGLSIFSCGMGLGISFQSVYLFHLSIIMLLYYFFLNAASGKRVVIPKIETKIPLFFIFMFIWYCITFFWSDNIFVSLKYIFYIAIGNFIILLLVYSSNDFAKLMKTFRIISVAFILQLLIGLLEVSTSFRYPLINNSYGVSNIPTGFHGNPNNFATFLNILMPFILYQKNWFVKFTGSVTILGLIIMTGSRLNFLTFIVIIAFYVYKNINGLKTRVLLLTGFPLLIIGFIKIIDKMKGSSYRELQDIGNMFQSFLEIFDKENLVANSTGVRWQLIEAAIQALKETNGLGIGAGNASLLKTDFLSTYEFVALHNFWLELLTEGGVVFFIIFVFIYIKMIYTLGKVSKSNNVLLSYFSKSSLLALLGFILGSISPSSTIYFFPMWILFGFAIAVINIYYKETYETR